ncbi:hypothetical protein ACQPZG_14990 [Streptomyces sp. CA-294286]|uniref:hypothetical protein n=1 Tax=Streptomyces sp. CA-294286 TaxID=3240070 RepID=UPI003D92CA5D
MSHTDRTDLTHTGRSDGRERTRRSAGTGWLRRTATAGAVAAAAGLLAAGPSAAGTATAGTPRTPEVPRISAGPYAGFQFCGGAQAPVVDTSPSPTFAATVVPNEGDPSYPFPQYPDMTGQFEIATPGSEATPFLRVTRPAANGRQLILQETVPAGSYRWRVRAEHRTLLSPWTAWCDFTVKAPTA